MQNFIISTNSAAYWVDTNKQASKQCYHMLQLKVTQNCPKVATKK